jgi:hypothetical protein
MTGAARHIRSSVVVWRQTGWPIDRLDQNYDV